MFVNKKSLVTADANRIFWYQNTRLLFKKSSDLKYWIFVDNTEQYLVSKDAYLERANTGVVGCNGSFYVRAFTGALGCNGQ